MEEVAGQMQGVLTYRLLMLGHVRDPMFLVICWCYVAVLFIQNGGEMETSEYGVLC